MALWIYVITATKVPTVRTGNSPFESYPEGIDPNGDGSTVGPLRETQFLPMTEEPEPVVNPVLLQTVRNSTVGDDAKSYRGAYDSNYQPTPYADGDWVVSWTTIAQDLDASKELKLDQLQQAQQVALDVGYNVGPYNFPFTESQFRLMADRLFFLDKAIDSAKIPAGTSITFSDSAGQEVSANQTSLRNNFENYGIDYLQIFEKEVTARGQIQAAGNVTNVDAVTWNF